MVLSFQAITRDQESVFSASLKQRCDFLIDETIWTRVARAELFLYFEKANSGATIPCAPANLTKGQTSGRLLTRQIAGEESKAERKGGLNAGICIIGVARYVLERPSGGLRRCGARQA